MELNTLYQFFLRLHEINGGQGGFAPSWRLSPHTPLSMWVHRKLVLFKKLPRLLLIATLAIGLIFAPIYPASADHASERGIKGDTSLKGIPNLEQMNQDTLEHYFGDVPDDHRPLFNPDDGKNVEVKDKMINNKILGSDKAIKPENMKDSPNSAKSK